MPEFKQHKSDELRAMFRSLVRSNCARGYTLETLSAMAEALQEGLANYAADAHLPHGQSADTLTRGILHLLNDPLNRDFIGDTLERGMTSLPTWRLSCSPNQSRNKSPSTRMSASS